MSRLAVVVALALLASGCNAIASTTTERPTVTPAPVPEAPTGTPTDGPTCIGPEVAADGFGARPTPATPVELGGENGTTDGRRLLDRHVEALSNHSYRLRTGLHELWVMRGGAAFTYRSVGYEWTTVRAYAVNGRLYTFVRTEYDTLEVTERRYRRERLSSDETVPTLTARRWLAGNVAPFEYAVVDRRTRNGTRVRVLRAAFDNASRGVTNATLYVDRRGIIRTAVVERIPPDARGNSTVTDRLTYSVTDLGTATPFRPPAFCRTDWSDANVNTLPGTATGTAVGR